MFNLKKPNFTEIFASSAAEQEDNPMFYAMTILQEQDEEIVRHEEMIALHPDEIDIYYKKAELLCNLARYNETLVECERIIGRFSGNAQLYAMKGFTFTMLGKLVEAISEYQNAIDADPYYTYSYYGLACCHLRLGHVVESELAIQTALMIDAKNLIEESFNPSHLDSLTMGNNDDSSSVENELL